MSARQRNLAERGCDFPRLATQDVVDLAEVEVLAQSRGMNANERHLDWIPTEIELRDEDDNVNANGNTDENGTDGSVATN